MTNFHRSLVISCSALAVASCGPDEIRSPGTGGDIVINNPPPAPAPTPTPAPTSAAVTPAAGCPTIPNADQLVDEGTISGPTGEYRICTMPARYTTSSTLPYIKGLLYRMNGRVDVGNDGGPLADASDGASDSNVTLTIEPGVVVYATGSSFMNVNRGSQIAAVGTRTRPIVFTSRDNVQGLNNDSSSGQWGGIVLSGRAPVTDCTVAPNAVPGSAQCERQVEGAAQPAIFGGATNNDSSGRMDYVQIRYSGFVLSGDNELQSLTTGGTGTGTQLSNIMSFNSSDDGVEFFGGFVNMKNLVVVGAEDDSIDTDTGVQANLQYVVAVQREGAGDAIIEADSSNANIENTPRQDTQIANAVFVHRSPSASQVLRFRGGTDYALANTVVVAPSGSACIRIDDSETARAAGAGPDEDGPPTFDSVLLNCSTNFRNGSNGGPTAAQAEAIFDAGSNNNKAFTNTLTMAYINGANEDAATAFNPTALSSFFDATTFVGAATGSNPARFTGWTCDSSTLTFGSNVGACTSLPVYN